MKITIGTSTTSIERDVPTHAERTRLPFKLRRHLMLEAVARHRRARLRVINGGKT